MIIDKLSKLAKIDLLLVVLEESKSWLLNLPNQNLGTILKINKKRFVLDTFSLLEFCNQDLPMFFDIVNSILLVTQPLSWIFTAKLAYNGNGCLGYVARELNLFDSSQNDVIDFHRVTRSKRRPKKELYLHRN